MIKGTSMGLINVGLIIAILCITNGVVAAYFSDSGLSIIARGKGNAITADHDGIVTSSKNPAAVTTVTYPQFKTYYSSHFGIIKNTSIAWGLPLNKRAAIAINIPAQLIENIQKRDIDGSYIGNFNDYLVVPMISIGYVWKDIAFGTSINYRYHQIDSETGTGTAINMGLRYARSRISLGASINNLGKQVNWSTGRQETYLPTSHMGVMVHFNTQSVLADVDFDHNNQNFIVNLGYELILYERLKLSVGISDLTARFQYGGGINLYLSQKMIVHYEYTQHRYLGQQHSAGVTIGY